MRPYIDAILCNLYSQKAAELSLSTIIVSVTFLPGIIVIVNEESVGRTELVNAYSL